MTDFASVSWSSPFTLPFSDIAGFLAFAREQRMAIARIEVLDGSGNLVRYPVAGSPDAPLASRLSCFSSAKTARRTWLRLSATTSKFWLKSPPKPVGKR
ncbi:hypothetical protein [Leisingera sp. ANG59]|uniref:hypothetical protein n=1 Tax=Leisingera sp. ANG59 TaxID=2675221 RepID=UPI001574C3CE|nr:hypothetical protein [Leisingera sp. ANG59]NSY38340.1 hypothetical protein [Leisingera sp. ANG59]